MEALSKITAEERQETAKTTEGAEKEESYAVSEEYYEEISAWEKGGMKDTNKRFIIGETSEALQSIGMKEQEIILSSGTIIQKLKKHPEMSIEIFKKIPELLEKPIIVQFSDAINKATGKPKYESRITVLGELYANVKEDGEVKEKPVLVSLELMPSNRKKSVILDFSIITSAYAKNSLQNYINNNTILYVNPDKKRTNKWLSLNRLQLPLGENQYGPIKIISYSEGKVKINNNSASIRYAVSEDYSDEVDNWYKSGQNEKKRFVLGSTGNVLQGLGAIESDIYFNSEKINKILSEHKEITIEEIKKIPDILEDPVIILKSMNKNRGNKQNTRLVIFGSVKGTDGRPVLSVLDIRPVENNFVINDMQKVSSVYTKDINPVDFVQNSDVLYADKKRAAHLLKSIGFKMPIELHQSDFIGSISYNKRSVNIEGKSFSEVFETKTSETASETAEGAEKYATDKADTTEESEEKKYFPKGEAPYRDVDVVSETDEGKNPRFIRTAAESEFTSEEMAKRLLEIAEEGSAAYDTYTDSEAVSDANRWFENQGNDLDKAAGKIEELIDAGALTSKKNFAKAQLVYNKLIEEAKNTADEYAAEKLLKRAENMIIDVAMAGTRAGQTVQAMRLLKRLSPEGRLIALEKSVDELNSQGKHKQPKEKRLKPKRLKKASNEGLMHSIVKVKKERFANSCLQDLRKSARMKPSSY